MTVEMLRLHSSANPGLLDAVENHVGRKATARKGLQVQASLHQ